jgi:hypothetical protein
MCGILARANDESGLAYVIGFIKMVRHLTFRISLPVVPRKPRIAVMLDENTTKGGDFYVTSKEYFWGIERAGGIPFAIPYVRDFVDFAVSEFDGYLSVGGDVAFPDDWYLPGHPSPDPCTLWHHRGHRTSR